VASSIAMAAAGWNWAKATEYRHKTAGLEGRERELAADLARVERESRSPRLFPPRIYELTRTMLDHAVHGQLGRLAARLRAENQNTTQLALDQCVAVADCIVNGRSDAWPPSEADLRMIAAITSSCRENPEYSEARVEPPAAIADPVVYDFRPGALRALFISRLLDMAHATPVREAVRRPRTGCPPVCPRNSASHGQWPWSSTYTSCSACIPGP
jgi:hypothetical protein